MWNTAAYVYISAAYGAVPFSTDIMTGTAVLDMVIVYVIAEAVANSAQISQTDDEGDNQ